MGDDLARFPTPKEAFKPKRPAHVSAAFDPIGNVPIPPQQHRHRLTNPQHYQQSSSAQQLAPAQQSSSMEYYSTPSTPDTRHTQPPYRSFSGPKPTINSNMADPYYQQQQQQQQQEQREMQLRLQREQQQRKEQQRREMMQIQQLQQQQKQQQQQLLRLQQQQLQQHQHHSQQPQQQQQQPRQTGYSAPRQSNNSPYLTPRNEQSTSHTSLTSQGAPTSADVPPQPAASNSYSSIGSNNSSNVSNNNTDYGNGSHRVPRRPLHGPGAGPGTKPQATLGDMGSGTGAAVLASGSAPQHQQQQQLQQQLQEQEQTSRDPADLRSLFDEVDRHKRGYLTERELSKALVNDDYTLFDAHTVRLMMKMFDRDGDGAIYFAEFGQLWKYLHDWRLVFDKFDTTHSDSISFDEFTRALAAFGYSLSATCVRFMFDAGSKLNRNGQREMTFDLFVQSCISIKSITDTFKRYDTDRDGYVTMGFEDFLIETTKLH